MKKRIITRASSDHVRQRDLHPVLVKVLNRRSCGYTDYLLKDLASPCAFKNIDLVVDRLMFHLHAQSKVLIVGDYDCDGATATAVAVRGLRLLGFTSIDYLIPNRFKTGYGLSEAIIDQALERDHKPDLLITVDNGITSVSGVDYARKHGIEVIITDHHLPGEQLPDIDTMINPQLPGDAFPSKAICGVGVIYYVLLALRKKLLETGNFTRDTQPNFMALIDLVTLGTIADCVPLDKNNRILIAHGLRRFRDGAICAGLQALMDAVKLTACSISAVDIAFKLAPKLNAAGRMDDMAIGVKCLLSEDYASAKLLAHRLVAFNEQRRDIQSSIQEEAMQQVLAQNNRNQALKAHILYHPEWHEGVIGIIASRIKDLTHKPTIVFTNDAHDHLKGSGRSISGIHLRDALANVQSRHPIIPKFGGHAMAAGLSIKKSDLDCFSRVFQSVISTYSDDYFTESIYTDGPLSPDALNLNTALALRAYGIWGQDYPEPLFDNEFQIKHLRLIKGKHLKLELQLDSRISVSAMWFFINESCYQSLSVGSYLRFFYKLDVNSYLGETSLNLIIEDADMIKEAVSGLA